MFVRRILTEQTLVGNRPPAQRAQTSDPGCTAPVSALLLACASASDVRTSEIRKQCEHGKRVIQNGERRSIKSRNIIEEKSKSPRFQNRKHGPPRSCSVSRVCHPRRESMPQFHLEAALHWGQSQYIRDSVFNETLVRSLS
jgi:hypothetical protein